MTKSFPCDLSSMLFFLNCSRLERTSIRTTDTMSNFATYSSSWCFKKSFVLASSTTNIVVLRWKKSNCNYMFSLWNIDRFSIYTFNTNLKHVWCISIIYNNYLKWLASRASEEICWSLNSWFINAVERFPYISSYATFWSISKLRNLRPG